jgi:Tfp pilus assembly protein PilX
MKQNIRRDSRRAGVSLVMVTFTVSILATLSVSMVMVTNSESKQKHADRQQVAALFAAEAGISEAVFALNSGKAGNIATSSTPLKQSGATYWVKETVLPNGMRSLVSTGTDNSSGVRVELTVKQDNASIWAWGAFGDDALSLDSNAHVDSYDSRLGDYASQQINGSGNSAYALTNGNIGSNGDITVSQNAAVEGNATCGPTSTTTVNGNATVSGSTVPNTGVVSIPALTMPSFGSAGNFVTSNNSNVTILAGDHEYDDFTLGTGSTLTVIGPARLVMDDFELLANSEMWIDSTAGPVEIYVWDDFIMNSNTILAPQNYSPEDLAVNLNSDNIVNPSQNVQLTEVSFESNSQLYAMLFAPNAAVDIDSNFELFGSVVGKEVHLDSWSRIHFDEALLNVTTNGGNPTWVPVCWRKMPFKAAVNANYP